MKITMEDKTGLEKMVDLLERELAISKKWEEESPANTPDVDTFDSGRGGILIWSLNKARQLLAEEQVQKPVPAGLVEEIRKLTRLFCDKKSREWDDHKNTEAELSYRFAYNTATHLAYELDKILSRYPASPVQEKSLTDLADRKGFGIRYSLENRFHILGKERVIQNTNEREVRQCLNSLPDLKGEGK